MRTAFMHRSATFIVLLALLLGACRPSPTPTPPPYTPPPPGTVSAVVIQRTPERGEELRPDGAIELVFDRAMDQASVEAAVRISPEVKGSFEWPDERTVRFQPDRPLKRESEYQVTVGAEARANDGNPLDGAYQFRFNTVGYLEVAQVIPADQTQDVEATGAITVIFNRPVVPLQVASDPTRADLPAQARQPLIIDPPISGTGEWLNTSIYIFTPDQPLAGGTTYRVRIEAGLTDTTGGVLDEAFIWSFSTQPPQVVWVSPTEDAGLVGVDAAVQVTFNMPVDAASAQAAFRLKGPGGAVAGTTTVDGPTLVFTPTNRLDFDSGYTARVDSDVRSLGGGQGMRAAYDWQFTTVPLPRILSTRPSDGQTDVPPYQPFEIQFNAPIDPASVMPNIDVTPPISPAQVYTYFNSGDNTFVLHFGAEPSTDYEVRIGPDIADPYGNKTSQAMTVRFRTAPLTPWAWLGVPNTVGTYDANQPARLLVGYLNTTRLDMKLYALDTEQFIQAQRDWWAYNPSGDPVRAWSLPVEAPLDQRKYAMVDLAEDGGALAPGVYLLDLRAPGVEYESWLHRCLLIVSPMNVTTKVAHGEAWVWVTDLATGRPVGNVALDAQDYQGQRLGQAVTGEDGRAAIALGEWHSYDPLYIVSDDPFILSGSAWEWSNGISPWEFGIEYGYEESRYGAHIYTDRPIYRPGQMVYYRAIFRNEDDVRYSLPSAETAQIVVYDAAGEEIQSERLALDDFGAVHGEIPLTEGASLGQYTIQTEVGGQGYYGSFAVAAYRQPEFELTVSPAQSELPAGQASQATVEVRYYFGGPVVDVPVEWNVLSTTYRFEPAQFGRYDFTDEDDPWVCRWCWWGEPESGRIVLSGSGQTDAQGNVTVALPTEIMTGGQRLTVEATAYGRDGQVISGRSDVVVHRGEFYIGLAPQQYVGSAGDELAVDVVTVDWQGRRVADRTLDVQVYRRDWVNTFVESEFGGSWKWETVDTLVYTGTVSTNRNAEGVITFTPTDGGSYRVVATGRDAHRREVRTSTWLWVSGSDYVSWRRENNDRITLISDKSAYVPGETAQILIPSPFAGEQWAWITVERGGILQQEVVRLESNSTVYELPITADHAPNVYVSVVIVKGPDVNEPVATHKVGYVPLQVEPVEQTLTISLAPSAERAEPGSTVTFDIRATDASGEPVEAAFSLDLVDKAVLSLQPREPDAIVTAFYGQRGLGVATASSLALSINRLLQEQLEKLSDQITNAERQAVAEETIVVEKEAEMPADAATAAPAPALAAQEGGMGGGRALDQAAALPADVELREEFADTAFWDATVTTDQTGRASVTVTLPDNLTTWVMRGVGVTGRTEVGEVTVDLLVTKPLLVRPVTPRFFVVGDRVQLAALVSNYTGEAQQVTVSLHGEGMTLADPATQLVAIPDGAEAKVSWWVTIEDVEAVDLAMSATAGDYSDAARPRLTTGPDGTLLVQRYTAPEIVGTGGQLVGEDVRTEAIALPPKYDDRRGELSIRLDPSLAAGMVDGLDYLEHFPYECTEQTVSRFLPNMLTYRALQSLGITDPELEERLPSLITEGLQKLYAQQQSDGGWGWWAGGESNPHLSAYVVFALVSAKQTDFAVDENVLTQALAYLEGKLISARELTSYREANQQAFILYVMSQAGRTSRVSTYVEGLYDRRERLSHYGRAFLAMTLQQADGEDSRIRTLLSDLTNAAILSATGAHWEEADYDWWAMNTDTRSTAVILDALVRLDPQNELIPQVVRWLMVARKDGIWETTQETAWAIIALTDWMVETQELKGQYDYTVTLNERTLTEDSVSADNVDQPIQLSVAIADLLAGASNRLTLERGPGEGRLYYTAHLNVFLPVEEIEPLNRGVIVSRQYCQPGTTASAAGDLSTSETPCEPLSEAGVSDVVEVRLTIIAPHDLYYVVVEDPLPAGGEAIDTSLATTSVLEQEALLMRAADEEWSWLNRWWWRWYSRSEMRDDRVVLFADYLPAGTYEYSYTFRATQAGEYRVIPTTAREFYFPEVFGRGAGSLFTVHEAQ